MVPDGWKTLELGALAKFTSGGTPSKTTKSFWGGIHPWISGKDLKQHYLSTSIDMLTEEGFDSVNKAPTGSTLVLVRGMTLLKDFPVGFATRPLAFNQDIKALIPEKNIDGLFLSFLLAGNKEKIRQLVSTAGHGTGRLDTESLKAYPVIVPRPIEQKKIAKVLSTWDQAITATEQLLKNSQLQKKALMQQLLMGRKRFPGFTGSWGLKKVGSLLKVRKIKKVPSDEFPLFSLTIENGITEKSERYNREFLVKNTDEKKYKLVNPKDIVYNPANLRWGAINYSRLNHPVLVSPIYEVLYVADEQKDHLDFIAQTLMSADQIRRFAAMVEGTLIERMAVKIEPFLATKIAIPSSLEEQQKIASALSSADSEIDALQQKLSCLNQEKKALMQQLLTGKRRVKVDELEVA